MNLSEYTAEDCADCPLPDCFPMNPSCLVLRAELTAQGIPVPELRKGIVKARGAPKDYRDRRDYLAQYKRNNTPVALKGVKVYRHSLEVLRVYCGDDLEAAIATLLEGIAEAVRERK